MNSTTPVLLLGSYHMRNPKTNVWNPEGEDVTTPRRQVELQALVERLSAFRPTHVAVERVPERQQELDRDLAAVRLGHRELSPDETEQIGFRLALAVDLPRVDAVDHQGEEGYGPLDLGEIYEWAKANDPERYAVMQEAGAVFMRDFEARRRGPLPDILRWLSDPGYAVHDHETYLVTAELGEPLGSIGAPWVNGWYHRNLRIYLNLACLAGPGERLFVVYGAGHLALLRHFLESSPHFSLEDVRDYL